MTVTVTHPPTTVRPTEAHPDRTPCPETFEAEPYTHVSESAYDLATVDASGQHPNMADQIASIGAPLTREQWDLLAGLANPSWTPTYERVYPDREKGIEAQTFQVADCPNCGTPVKVG